MKRNNKGFTLAELLIVIAIIAILIAIAIPVFAGQLDNARIQTDHANMRSAYAMAQVATLEGVIYTGSDGKTPYQPNSAGDFVFNADGSISAGSAANAYKLKATVAGSLTAAACESSAVCRTTGNAHSKDNVIIIRYATNGTYTVVTAPASSVGAAPGNALTP